LYIALFTGVITIEMEIDKMKAKKIPSASPKQKLEKVMMR